MFAGRGNPNCFSLACLSAAEIQKAENCYKRKINSGLRSSALAELFWMLLQPAEGVSRHGS